MNKSEIAVRCSTGFFAAELRVTEENRHWLLAAGSDSSDRRGIQGSALVTLGITIGDVGAWSFVLWLCVDWFFNLDRKQEGFMKTAYYTGMDALAVLRSQEE